MTGAPTWPCEAYGDAGVAIGAALCFQAPALGERVCDTADQCARVMGHERRRVFRRLSELAADPAGDPVYREIADEFATPDDLLGGPGSRA